MRKQNVNQFINVVHGLSARPSNFAMGKLANEYGLPVSMGTVLVKTGVVERIGPKGKPVYKWVANEPDESLINHVIKSHERYEAKYLNNVPLEVRLTPEKKNKPTWEKPSKKIREPRQNVKGNIQVAKKVLSSLGETFSKSEFIKEAEGYGKDINWCTLILSSYRTRLKIKHRKYNTYDQEVTYQEKVQDRNWPQIVKAQELRNRSQRERIDSLTSLNNQLKKNLLDKERAISSLKSHVQQPEEVKLKERR